jgi:hypothetical protein
MARRSRNTVLKGGHVKLKESFCKTEMFVEASKSLPSKKAKVSQALASISQMCTGKIHREGRHLIVAHILSKLSLAVGSPACENEKFEAVKSRKAFVS